MTVYFTCILPLDITRKSYTITGREPYRQRRACLLLFDQLPARIRVVFGDGGGDCRSIRAEVFLIDPALVIDDESHHAGAAPLGGPRHQRGAGDHVAGDDVAESSSPSVIARHPPVAGAAQAGRESTRLNSSAPVISVY